MNRLNRRPLAVRQSYRSATVATSVPAGLAPRIGMLALAIAAFLTFAAVPALASNGDQLGITEDSGFPIEERPLCTATNAAAVGQWVGGQLEPVTATVLGGTVTVSSSGGEDAGPGAVWICTGTPDPMRVPSLNGHPSMTVIVYLSLDSENYTNLHWSDVDYVIHSQHITPDSVLYSTDPSNGVTQIDPPQMSVTAGEIRFQLSSPQAILIGDPHASVAPTPGPAASVAEGPAPIATSMPTPRQVFADPLAIVVTAVVAIVGLAFITFPANVFNKTFEEHYEDIVGIRNRWMRRSRRQPGDRPRSEASRRIAFGAVVVAGAFLGGLLNPQAGFNTQTLAAVIAAALVVLASARIAVVVSRLYRRARHREAANHLQALPLGLLVAALCVVISRLSDFQPGYLYGVVAGVVFTTKLLEHEEGQVVAIEHGTVMVAGIACWLLWLPVNSWATAHPTVFPLALLDDFLASMFAAALVGNVVAMLPLTHFPGRAVTRWHRGAWGAIFGIALFALLLVLVHPNGGNHPGAVAWMTAGVLFIGFGGGSLVFKWFMDKRFPRGDDDARPVDPSATASPTDDTAVTMPLLRIPVVVGTPTGALAPPTPSAGSTPVQVPPAAGEPITPAAAEESPLRSDREPGHRLHPSDRGGG